MKKSLFIYLLCLNIIILALVIAIYMLHRSQFSVRTYEPLSNTENNAEYTLSYKYLLQNEYYERQDAFVPSDAILVLGDSHVQGLCTMAIAPNCINFGISGDTSLGILHRLAKYKSLQQASALVIEIGANDIRFFSMKEITNNFHSIINFVSLDLPVLICSVFPFQEYLADTIISNEDIVELNSMLRELCAQHANCHFVDVYQLIVNADGSLAANLCLDDGVHLNDTGYRIWITALQQKLTELQLY